MTNQDDTEQLLVGLAAIIAAVGLAKACFVNNINNIVSTIFNSFMMNCTAGC